MNDDEGKEVVTYFGRGEYSKDVELDFRRPVQPVTSHIKLHEPLRKVSFVVGVILIISSILTLLVVMLGVMNFQGTGLISSLYTDSNASSVIDFIPTVPPVVAPSFHSKDIQQLVHTDGIGTGTLWSVDFVPATTELTMTTVDANGDGKPDLLVVQVTDRLEKIEYCGVDKCKEEFGHAPCQVQLAALSGEDGSVVWKTWIEFAPFAANCKHDLNRDAHPDCILSGRGGSLVAIDITHGGSLLWVVDPQPTFLMYNFYYPLIVRDFDKDGTLDLIVTHGGDVFYSPSFKNRTPGVLLVVSGHTGEQLSERIPMPDDKETYSSPVLYNLSDHIQLVLFGSGGETVSGSLWAVTLDSLQFHVDSWLLEKATNEYSPFMSYRNPRCLSSDEYEPKRPQNSLGTFKYTKEKEDWLAKCPIWNDDIQPLWNPYKVCVYELVPAGRTGTITPPVIIDYNGDGIKDLLVSQFNDHIMMIDGATTSVRWDHYTEDTQSYSIPSPLYFNDDTTPDFLVQFNKGKWMVYDYSYMGVISGANGELLWSLNCSLETMASPVTIKSSKQENDGMLFFARGCNEWGEEKEIKTRPKKYQREACKTDQHLEQADCEWQSETGERPAKRHGEEQDGGVTAEELSDLWEPANEYDTFPDPWSDSRSFIETYCQLSYNTLTTNVYYLTPGMIASGNIKPIYKYEPYVYKFPFELFSNSEPSSSHSSNDRRKSIRCSQVLTPSILVSTPIIGDFNQDNRLDGAITVAYISHNNELNVFNSQKVNYRVFDIKERLVEVYGSDILNTVDFNSYYPAHDQPWGGYMGSRGDATYLYNGSSK